MSDMTTNEWVVVAGLAVFVFVILYKMWQSNRKNRSTGGASGGKKGSGTRLS